MSPSYEWWELPGADDLAECRDCGWTGVSLKAFDAAMAHMYETHHRVSIAGRV